MAGLEILGNLLKDVGAPVLGAVVKQVIPGEGPIDDAAGKLTDGLVKGLAEALGAEPTPEAVADAIKRDPVAGADAAQRVENEQRSAIAQLMDLQLRAQTHARDTTVALVREGSLIAWGPSVYSAAVVAMFAAVLFTLLFKPVHISDAAGAILNILLGVLTREMAAVGGYFLGSSQASKEKDATIASALSAAAAPVGRAVGGVIAKAVNPSPPPPRK